MLIHPLKFERETETFSSIIAFTSIEDPEVNVSFDHPTFLSDQDLNRFKAMGNAQRRKEFVLGRYLAQVAAQRLLETDRPIQFSTGVFKQLVVTSDPNLEISISHSKDYCVAVATTAQHPIAIDMEQVNFERLAAIDRNLTIPERELSNGSFLSTNILEFKTVLWTAKEALSKVLRVGMTVNFKFLEVAPELIGLKGGVYSGHFANFSQYRWESILYNGDVITLVYPKNSILKPSLEVIFK